jgi:hypothetical protein
MTILLQSTEPWKHPKTGIYWCRQPLPEALRSFARGGRGEPKWAYRRSLHTRERRIANRRLVDALGEYLKYERELEARKARAASVALLPRDANELTTSAPPTEPQSSDALFDLAASLGEDLLRGREGKSPGREAFTHRRSIPPGEWGHPTRRMTERFC